MKNKVVMIVLLVIGMGSIASAEDIFISIIKKQEQKKSSRWTLSGWLEQKERNRLMDQWLAANTNETFHEFAFSLGNTAYDTKIDDVDQNNQKKYNDFEVYYFYEWLGLNYKMKQQATDDSINDIQLKVRILGSSQQSTHINLNFGQSKLKNSTAEYKFMSYGIDFDFYILDWIGLSSNYTVYPIEEVGGQELELRSSRYGLFIESGVIRLFGNIYSEKRKYSSEEERSGLETGVMFSF